METSTNSRKLLFGWFSAPLAMAVARSKIDGEGSVEFIHWHIIILPGGAACKIIGNNRKADKEDFCIGG